MEVFIYGREVEVAVMGSETPVAFAYGRIKSSADFCDYEVKHITDTFVAYIPGRIDKRLAEPVREQVVKEYIAPDCKGLSRVNFLVTYEDNRVVFNEVNTLPGLTSISIYPKLFAAGEINFDVLLDRLLKSAMEVFV